MFERGANCSLIMLESGEQATIDIEATVSCKCSSNTLEIRLKRHTEVLLVHQRDGSVDIIGSQPEADVSASTSRIRFQLFFSYCAVFTLQLKVGSGKVLA
ncbi:unnamed protein product [Brassica napus]|uniref:(rape) hypothetical protein n=1 Tax=Brassica napus TaxID=3708 RepID=A0A816X5N4_BRANA|nr:unnamed protein product [Brassica napus]